MLEVGPADGRYHCRLGHGRTDEALLSAHDAEHERPTPVSRSVSAEGGNGLELFGHSAGDGPENRGNVSRIDVGMPGFSYPRCAAER